MAVITIFRQAGCEGLYIAKKLAETLGYQYTDYESAERILVNYGYEEVGEVYGSVPDFWERFTKKGPERDEINSMLRSVVLAEAQHGNVVILGRACFAALQGLSDVLNVRVKAPLPLRISRVMSFLQITREEAVAHVEEKDKLVADFARTSYGVSPDELGLFDLVVDSGRVHPDTIVRWLAEAARALPVEGDEAPAAGELEVNPFIARAVSRELERRARQMAKERG